jgi:Ni,Fe-hydrogenase maturation factor
METSNISSLHDVDFITSLRLGKTLDIDLTENILFIAVEIEEDLVFSEEFTPELKKRYPEILETVSGLIREVV